MKVWIDILTPKQANFFAPLVKRLRKRGVRVLVTTREYREVNELLEIRKIPALKVGQHGGAALRDKLIASSERVTQLARLSALHDCQYAISFSSPEAARVAYGLSIPHYCISDSPHAEATSRLTIPLSNTLFTPKIIPLSAWIEYGIDSSRIVRYDALDPVVWLRDLKPTPTILDELGLDRSKPIVTIRPEESQASYLLNRGFSKSIFMLLGRALLREMPSIQIVIVPRYDPRALLRKQMRRSVVIPCSAIDATSLLYYSNLFLGGGGTMTAEAALLGVPSVSFYPGPATYVDRYLTSLGLVTRIRSVGAIVRHAIRILRNPRYEKALKARSKKIISRMEDPIKIVERHLK